MRENVDSSKNHDKENSPMKSMSPTGFVFRKEGRKVKQYVDGTLFISVHPGISKSSF